MLLTYKCRKICIAYALTIFIHFVINENKISTVKILTNSKGYGKKRKSISLKILHLRISSSNFPDDKNTTLYLTFHHLRRMFFGINKLVTGITKGEEELRNIYYFSTFVIPIFFPSVHDTCYVFIVLDVYR